MARGKLNQGHPLSRHLRVALMLVLVLGLLAYSVWQVGQLFDVFASRYTLHTLVEGSGGLIEGAPVTLAGQRVGQVDEIRFIPVGERHDEASLAVRLSVNESVRDQIRGDSEALLRTQGLLGDRFVDIVPGTAPYPVLQPGDTLPSQPPLDYEDVLQTAAGTLDQVQNVVSDLEVMTERLVAGEGTVGALLADDRLYERMVVASGELSQLLTAMNRSDGTIGRLIRDPALYEQMNRSLARLDSLGA
ncbi:MAG TPA: MlaD family protein, partial [Longimicrobiales bacterium]|nr:MlaD family protein [Longimicrobiales bacterium]